MKLVMRHFEMITTFLLFQILERFLCLSDYSECPPHQFKLTGMKNCVPWLTCKDIENITVIKPIGKGAVKDVYLVKWKEMSLVLSLPANPKYIEDFIDGVETLKLLNPSKHIVQFVGYCDKMKALFTEYHPAGNAADFLKHREFNILQCLQFCLQYSHILNFLHNGPAGRRVFCDSNSLEKLLSQLLVTSSTKLILNDVDALPAVVNTSGIKCGRRELTGEFVAPEQLWTKPGEFRGDLMSGYDEKTDIWKAATVCDFFLKRSTAGDVVRYRLFDLHSRCKNHDPKLRPSIDELINEYTAVIEEYSSNSEL